MRDVEGVPLLADSKAAPTVGSAAANRTPHQFCISECCYSAIHSDKNPLRFCCLRMRSYYKLLLVLLIVVAMIGSLLLLVRQQSESADTTNSFIWDAFNDEQQENTGCLIPNLDPWDSSIKQYIRDKPATVTCGRHQPELTVLHSVNQRVWFNDSELAAANWTMNELDCSYRGFDFKQNNDFDVKYYEWAKLENGTYIDIEMIEVKCKRNGTAVYENAHNQIIPLSSESPSINNNTNNRSETNRISDNTAPPFLDRPNIIMFVIDSMSHSSWRRELPKVLETLKSKYNPFIFDGHVKVGENSFPNAMAFLTGKVSYIPNKKAELPDKYKIQHYDNWPFVFKDYQKHGYAVYFAEDMRDYQLFTYNKRGFLKKPVDHYYRPYLLHLRQGPLAHKSWWLCFGNNNRQNIQLEYFQQFIRKYLNDTAALNETAAVNETHVTYEEEKEKNRPESTKIPKRRRPIFGINWFSDFSHNDNVISAADGDFTKFFEENAALMTSDSFVFVMGDHGHRFDQIRKTSIGRIEEQMPFFSVHVPPRLLQRFPTLERTIRTNTKRLSTWWDLYVTFREILDLGVNDRWQDLENSSQPIERYRNDYGTVRGLSLLRRLPYNRTCESAEIPQEFCVCEQETPLNATDNDAIAAGNALIAHLNALIKNGTDEEGNLCQKLKLKELNRASVFSHNIQMSKLNTTSNNYRIAVKAEPSDALFEGTLSQTNGTAFEVVGEISRLNMYGTQSHCIKNNILQKYCYCKEQL